MSHSRPPSPETSARWRIFHFDGLFFDDFCTDSAWIRETGVLQLPPSDGVSELVLRGEFRPHPAARGLETGAPSLTVALDGTTVAVLADLPPGPFDVRLPLASEIASRGFTLTLRLGDTGLTNALAWLSRVTGIGAWQHFRRQNKNRQLRIATLATSEGEVVFDFSQRLAPFSAAFARHHARLGMNITGFLAADLGIGESARCMVRAADAAHIATALVPLRLHSKNRLGDLTFADRLQAANPHHVNVVHIDAPASRDLDHHHPGFREGKYNIAYWAWELPEFPDAWVPNFSFFHEVWCPSDFVNSAIAMKSPLPVVTMPHAIAFARPEGDFRAKFGLPAGQFLFLSLYDLNSYSERKNPRAAVEAFRQSGLAGRGAALVMKVQNVAGNEADFAALQAAVADLPGTVIISATLARDEIYQLESACDAFVSLHRSEGFGIAVAEAMFLGKPVISTDWSATHEFVTRDNGCPVHCRVVAIGRSHGPYAKGQLWAEPDVAHAAAIMRKLFTDRALGAALGAAARATIETRFSPAAIGARYRKRLESIATF